MEKPVQLIICLGSSCFARGNKWNVKEIDAFLKEHSLDTFVDFKGARCFGDCKNGPFCKINNQLYSISNIEELKQLLLNIISELKK